MKRASVVMGVGMLVAAMVGSGLVAAAGGGASLIAHPGAVRHGMTYPEWEGAYQIWLEEISLRRNPLFDPGSPRNCELQPGNTVFVGASGADCAVPSGATITLGGPFWECSTAEGHGETYRELRRCSIENFARDLGPQASHITWKIDGAIVKHPRKWTFTTPGEIIDFPKNNLWRAEPGPSKSVTTGMIFIIRPLPEGTHHIRAHVVDVVFGTFNVDWTLHVG